MKHLILGALVALSLQAHASREDELFHILTVSRQAVLESPRTIEERTNFAQVIQAVEKILCTDESGNFDPDIGADDLDCGNLDPRGWK